MIGSPRCGGLPLEHDVMKGTNMIRWAIIFAILALVAGVLGFGNMAGDFAYIAKILLFVFLVLFVISLVMGRRVLDPPV